ncbi:MAG TPA: hypothetical protein VFV99_16350, partial [Kofleriaceae bacterium]|nr:hypothetical protein [Kofleriaceae bacterium]
SQADAIVLANVFVSYRDLYIKGLEAGLGVYNLLDHDNNFYQPYDGGHAPLRDASRQLLLRVGYTVPL